MKKMMGLVNVNNRSGFTLVELLIVVIILAVLAAIVIPQFSSSTDEARESALRSTLLQMRNAVELYSHQHNGNYPGAILTDGSGPTTTVAEAQTAFTNQLTLFSDVNGQTAVARDPAAVPPIRFGPYLKQTNLPVNPIDGTATLTVVIATAANAGALDQPAAPAVGDTGWWYDVVSGKFIAYTPGQGIDGTDYYLW